MKKANSALSIAGGSAHTTAGRKKILLLKPRGFCAGVVRAVDIVNIALDSFGPPIFVRKEIVHNARVVADLTKRGAIFVESLAEVPESARVIFSAHGVAPEVRQQASSRRLRVIDATCPLVTKVHLEAIRFAQAGYSIILIGHKEHDEVVGTLGEAPLQTQLISSEEEVQHLSVPDPSRVAYLTQTTLSLDEAKGIIEALRKKFPQIVSPPAQDICYATENRQVAVKAVAPECDLLLVVGSANSSNSNRLVEVAQNTGLASFLIEDQSSIDPAWLSASNTIAVTAGASAPEYLVQNVISHLKNQGFQDLEELEIVSEDVRFGLPPELVNVEIPGVRATANL